MKHLPLILAILIAGCGEPVKPFPEAYVEYTNYHDKQYMGEREIGRHGIVMTDAVEYLFNFNISGAEFVAKHPNRPFDTTEEMGRVRELQSSLTRATEILGRDLKDHKIALENHKAKLDALRRSLEASAKKEGREKEVPADDYTDYPKKLDEDIAASKEKLVKLKTRFNKTITAAKLVDEVGLVK
jgi:hypothetical protein